MKRSGQLGALVSALTVAALLGTAGSGSAAPSSGADGATTQREESPELEARRVDRVPTPEPEWYDCTLAFGPGNECATVDLPLDYDRTRGRTTQVAVLRHPAADQTTKLGTLFVNPGGPGGSGVLMAAAAPFFLGPELLERFDVVGFDPRGTNFSDNTRCWEHVGAEIADARGLLEVPFPLTDAEETGYITSSAAIGGACASIDNRLLGSMSTAQVARDMDVLRRTVGDDRLTYLGFSYGSYLGTVYANMFPDRVRAVAIDGVLDPLAWAGTPQTSDIPQTSRLRSGEGSWQAFAEILERCSDAGPDFCLLAGIGDPAQVATEVFDRLREAPLEIVDPFTGEVFALTYATVLSLLLSDLYSPDAAQLVDLDLASFRSLLQEQVAPGSVDGAAVASARASLVEKVRTARQQTGAGGRQGTESGFAYSNFLEAFLGVLCTDGTNPASAASWRQHADESAVAAPRFGRLWTWQSAPCASDTWTVRDEDAYAGPFDTRTANPVLVVGNFWDPATNYEGAVTTAGLLPNSTLLSSDSWGHTAYGTSTCVTDAVDTYLLTVRTPEPDTLCVGDVQPFTVPLAGPPEGPDAQRRAGVPDRLPPVVPPLPGAVPRR